MTAIGKKALAATEARIGSTWEDPKWTLAQTARIYVDALDAERELKRRRLGRTKRFQAVKSWRQHAETELRKALANGAT